MATTLGLCRTYSFYCLQRFLRESSRKQLRKQSPSALSVAHSLCNAGDWLGLSHINLDLRSWRATKANCPPRSDLFVGGSRCHSTCGGLWCQNNESQAVYSSSASFFVLLSPLLYTVTLSTFYFLQSLIIRCAGNCIERCNPCT